MFCLGISHNALASFGMFYEYLCEWDKLLVMYAGFTGRQDGVVNIAGNLIEVEREDRVKFSDTRTCIVSSCISFHSFITGKQGSYYHKT